MNRPPQHSSAPNGNRTGFIVIAVLIAVAIAAFYLLKH